MADALFLANPAAPIRNGQPVIGMPGKAGVRYQVLASRYANSPSFSGVQSTIINRYHWLDFPYIVLQ